MMVKTTLIALLLCLVCNAFLPLLSLPSTPNAYTALAFKPTNNKNTNNNTAPISKPPVVVNHVPVVKVGPNQTVNENATVMLVGFAFDPDPNDKLSYLWKQIAGPAVKLTNNTSTNPSFTAPRVSSDTQLKFLLTAKDDKGAASNNPATATITVKHINRPPIAITGQNQIVNPGDVVSLDGSKSKDPDGDPITYLWTQTSGRPAVKLDGASSPIATFTAPSNMGSDIDLLFGLTVKDSKNATNTATVKVTDKYIPPPNKQPVANTGQNQTVNSGDKVILDGSGSKDPDGNITSYSWTQTAGPPVTLNSNSTANPTFTAPTVSHDTDLKFSLIAKDNRGALSGPAVVTVIVKHVNHPPVANAGQSQTVNAGYVVSLDGSGSRDPDGDPIKYSWMQTAGPSVNLTGADSTIATFTAPSNISSDTDLAFNLTVTDDKNATNTATVKVTDKYVPPPNQPPISNAGSDQTVNAGDSVTLDGSGSRDPDGNITSYSWTQIAGPPVTLNGADTATAQFVAPSSDITLKFSLTVKDDKGAISQPSTVAVTVKAAPPAITPPPVSNQTGNATSMTTTQSNQTNNATAIEYLFVRKWGTNGTADGQFDRPYGVAVDSSSGNVYVADSGNNRIQKFDSNGSFITKWGSKGTADGQFNLPARVAVDSPSGNVYVADRDNNRIQKFDSNGSFITKWGSSGSADGQFNIPTGLAIDSSGNVYVADFSNDDIQKFNSNGAFITKWGSYGSADGQFSGASGVALDSSGNVFVAEQNNNRIQKFNSNGAFITKWGSYGSADGQFHTPTGLAIDSSGNVYVTDWGNDRIQVFAPSR